MFEKHITATIQDLSIQQNSHRILNKASFDLAIGELTFLVGPSGSGKTSLLYTLNRLSAHFPSLHAEGNIRLLMDDHWVEVFPNLTLPMQELRCKVSMVFQVPHLLPGSVRKNFSLPLMLVKKFTQEETDEMMEMQLHEVCLWDEIKDRIDEPANELSIGQQQRLCLARSLAMEPDFLLIDEPTSALDSVSAQQILSLLKSLRRRYTILIVSHHEKEWEQYADRVWLLKNKDILPIS